MVGQGTEHVASLLNVVEKLGEMPHSIQCVVYGLIPNHKPGKVAYMGASRPPFPVQAAGQDPPTGGCHVGGIPLQAARGIPTRGWVC